MAAYGAHSRAKATESLGLRCAHGYNLPASRNRHRSGCARHLSEGRCSSLKDLFRIPKPAFQQCIAADSNQPSRLSGSDGALTIRINGAHSQTTNGVLLHVFQ
jgi:hypothetical protein